MENKNSNRINLDDILNSLKKEIKQKLDSLKKEIENKLDSLKKEILTKVNYFYFKNGDNKFKMENKIINLINEEIIRSKFITLNLKENKNFDVNKEIQNVSNSLNSQAQSNTLIITKSKIVKPLKKKFFIKLNPTNPKMKGISVDQKINHKEVFPQNNIDQENNLNQNAQNIERLDYFTSKDIQEENKEITRTFQKEALNYINDNEEKENKNIAKYLVLMANA